VSLMNHLRRCALALGLTLLGCGPLPSAELELEPAGSREAALAPTTSLLPNSDGTAANVAPSTGTVRYAVVDDTSDTDFLRLVPGASSGYQEFDGWRTLDGTALPGTVVSRAEVRFRAQRTGADESVHVELWEGSQRLARGAERALSTTWASYTQVFTGAFDNGPQVAALHVRRAADLRVRLVFHNPDASSETAGPARVSSVQLVVTVARQPLSGLMSAWGPPPERPEFAYMNSFVVPIEWRELESASGWLEVGWDKIDAAIAEANQRGMGIRLRIHAGTRAPDFVKSKVVLSNGLRHRSGDGIDCSASGGIAVQTPHGQGCAAAFWKPEVLTEYEELMAEVARRYEGTPSMREVVASGCQTLFAEPFYRAHSDRGSNQRLFAEGLDYAADLSCHERVIRFHARTFHAMRTSLALNPWDIIVNPEGDLLGPPDNWVRARDFADWARGWMGSRLLLQNNGKGEDTSEKCGSTDPAVNYWCYIKFYPGSRGFQSETWKRLHKLDDADASNNLPPPQGMLRAIDSSLSDNGRFLEFSDNTVFNSFQLEWQDDFETRHHQLAAKSFTEF